MRFLLFVIPILLQLGCATAPKKTPMVTAAARGNLSQVQGFLQAGEPLNLGNQMGTTALMAASFKGHIKVTAEILKAGADPNQTDGKGTTALHYAAQKGHVEVLSQLIGHGANLEVVNEYGVTPLITAVQNQQLAALRVMLDAGAQANSKPQKDIWYPLQFAASRNWVQGLELLVQSGADVNALDDSNESALIIANVYLALDSVRWLLNKKAKLQPEGGVDAFLFACSTKSKPLLGIYLELRPSLQCP